MFEVYHRLTQMIPIFIDILRILQISSTRWIVWHESFIWTEVTSCSRTFIKLRGGTNRWLTWFYAITYNIAIRSAIAPVTLKIETLQSGTHHCGIYLWFRLVLLRHCRESQCPVMCTLGALVQHSSWRNTSTVCPYKSLHRNGDAASTGSPHPLFSARNDKNVKQRSTASIVCNRFHFLPRLFYSSWSATSSALSMFLSI